jgi:hypothetical protein
VALIAGEWRWSGASGVGSGAKRSLRRLRHAFLVSKKRILIPDFGKFKSSIGPNWNQAMLEKVIVDGKTYYKYNDGRLMPEDKHLKNIARLNTKGKEGREEQKRRRQYKKLSIGKVRRHIHHYIWKEDLMDIPCNKRSKKALGLPLDEEITWREALWAMLSVEALEFKNMKAVDSLIELSKEQEHKKQQRFEREYKAREQDWKMNGKSRQVETEVVENNFGEDGV